MVKVGDWVIVWWHDAHGNAEAKYTTKCRPYQKVSTGFVIARNKMGVELAAELNEDGSVEYSAFIPAGMIRGIKAAKMPTPPKGWRHGTEKRKTDRRQ